MGQGAVQDHKARLQEQEWLNQMEAQVAALEGQFTGDQYEKAKADLELLVGAE